MVCDELRRNVAELHMDPKEQDVAQMKGWAKVLQVCRCKGCMWRGWGVVWCGVYMWSVYVECVCVWCGGYMYMWSVCWCGGYMWCVCGVEGICGVCGVEGICGVCGVEGTCICGVAVVWRVHLYVEWVVMYFVVLCAHVWYMKVCF